MKTKSISFISFIILNGLAFGQFGALNKARNLAGNANNNPSNNSNSNSSNNSNNNSNTNNNSTNATPASSTNTKPANTGNTASTNTNSSSTGNTSKAGNSAAKTALIPVSFSNSAGQKSQDYKDGDVINVRIDFTGAMKDAGSSQYNGAFFIELYDGAALLNGTIFVHGTKLDFLKDDDLSKPYFEFQVVCAPRDAKYPITAALTKSMVDNKLSKSSHTMKVKLLRSDKYSNESGIAEGSFNLDLTNGNDKLKAQAEAFEAVEIEGRRMPQAVMRNAAIEKDLMNIVQYDFEEKIVPLRAVIDESDWEILRDDYNVITGRTIAGYVAFKVPRNGRCFYERLTIYQPYAGGGKYGLSKYYDTRHGSDHIEIKPENVMK